MTSIKNVIVIQQTNAMLEVLHQQRCKIMEAKDCIDGIRKTVRYAPDLIVAEIEIPVLTGFSMAKILKILQINIPVILTSFIEKNREKVAALENVAAFMLNPSVGSESNIKKLGLEFDLIRRKLKEDVRSKSTHLYKFRQHEWANLIGLSEKERILIVEDDASFRILTLKKLDLAGKYELYSAQDGLEGIFKALLVEPHLILTDIMMPVLDGMAMSQMFYILNKPFPIVFLSSKEDEETRRKAQKATGVLGYLAKKTIADTEYFMNQVEKYLSRANAWHQAQEELFQKGTIETLKKMEESKTPF